MKLGSGSNNDDEKESSFWRAFAIFIDAYRKAKHAKNQRECAANNAANRTAWATVWIAIFTVVMAGVGIAQWCVLSGQQTIMQGQLNEMENEQRPWLKPIIQVVGLKFDESKNANIAYFLTFKNIGKSPAQNIQSAIAAHVVTGKTAIDSISEEKHQCQVASQISKNATFPGLFAFPDEEAPQIIGGKGIGTLQVSSVEYENAWPASNRIIFKIIGCFDYLLSSSHHGQIGFAYFLSKKMPDNPQIQTGFAPALGEVAPDQFIFRPDPFSSGVVK